ncbi:phasin family protein [uncultured Sphingomonas sp.]|uniref:phasin family protein n=1 Tax=uncultured Sphingomonas sp. TaxID=158754 RepID=UPI0025D5A535|nr:phasin family protein [uncultured Sphingomonas sp.]
MAKNPNEAMDQATESARAGMDAAQDGARRAGEQMQDGMARATEGMQAAGERMKATGEAMADAGSQLGLKMLDQAETNTREAFQAMRSAAQASDVTEVMRIQAEFLREQGSRSVSQVREIGELIADFGRNAIGQMTGRR